MTTEPHVPADTQMMRIVHQAMRRDLHRSTDVVGSHTARVASRDRRPSRGTSHG